MPDIPAGCQMARRWSVQVHVYGETLLTIEEGALSGLADLGPWASTIRACAQHLLAFIGPAEPVPPDAFATQLDAGAPLAPEPESLEPSEADAISMPHPLAEQVARARTDIASWPAERLANVQLQGSGGIDR